MLGITGKEQLKKSHLDYLCKDEIFFMALICRGPIIMKGIDTSVSKHMWPSTGKSVLTTVYKYKWNLHNTDFPHMYSKQTWFWN